MRLSTKTSVILESVTSDKNYLNNSASFYVSKKELIETVRRYDYVTINHLNSETGENKNSCFIPVAQFIDGLKSFEGEDYQGLYCRY